jgi:hypothetical protein
MSADHSTVAVRYVLTPDVLVGSTASYRMPLSPILFRQPGFGAGTTHRLRWVHSKHICHGVNQNITLSGDMRHSYSSLVDVRYDGTVTGDERAEVEAWIRAHQTEDIDHVTIGAGAVVIHSAHSRPNRVRSGVAIRYPGRLSAALDEALATLRSRE